MDQIVVLASIVVMNFLQIESKLSKLPAPNQVVRVGRFVKFECFTENKGYPPSWTHVSVGSSNQADVYLLYPGPNNEPLGRMKEAYYNRGFRVKENRETGEYSLEIQSVKLEDAGEYTCGARGGLGQSASAQLTVVIDLSPVCETNETEEVLGTNSCGKEPDMISFACTFGVSGNSLPQVMWVKTENTTSVVKVGPAQWTGEPGRAISKFVAKACRKDLTESSFTCIVKTSDPMEVEARLSCDMPKINVLEISNITNYETVSSPEEVQCDSSSFRNSIGCKWVRREKSDEVVSKSQQLNLYRPEMKPGIYVCIVDCRIRGEVCQFEAFGIKYTGQLPETGTTSSSQETSGVTVFITVVIITVFAIAIAFAFFRRKELAQHFVKPYGIEAYTPSTATESLSHDANQSPSSSANDTGSGKQGNGELSQESGRAATLIGQHNGGDVSVSMPLASDGLDHGDSHNTFVPGSRKARLRDLETKARNRIRANAASTAQHRSGTSMLNEDIAEGIPDVPTNPEKKSE